jgi:chemotaxis-related protein WspD
MLEHAQTTADVARANINDCWNRIGVRGDHSCPELTHYLRCLNCPTFATAAVDMLDRATTESDLIGGWGQADQATVYNDKTQSALVFRVGEEWLALPPQVITEVAPHNVIHSLPHQKNNAVLGLTNIRGVLVLCVSLAHMLHIESDKKAQQRARLLVVTHAGQKLVFPVDEVHGVYRYGQSELLAAPTTLAHSGVSYTKNLIAWDNHKVGLLDCELLYYTLNRSLA